VLACPQCWARGRRIADSRSPQCMEAVALRRSAANQDLPQQRRRRAADPERPRTLERASPPRALVRCSQGNPWPREQASAAQALSQDLSWHTNNASTGENGPAVPPSRSGALPWRRAQGLGSLTPILSSNGGSRVLLPCRRPGLQRPSQRLTPSPGSREPGCPEGCRGRGGRNVTARDSCCTRSVDSD